MRLPFLSRSEAAGDLAECKAILAQGSKSFAAASRLLPRRVRDPAAAVYAFCRVADDAVDAQGASQAALDRLRQRLDAIYAQQPEPSAVDRSLARVVARNDLPRRAFDLLLDGFRWDLDGRAYRSIDDVCAYGVRVASTVGVLMTALMGPRDGRTLDRACELGVAMQLTNIARDVGEDARAGRVYLPESWIRDAGLDPAAVLERPAFSPELGSVIARLLRFATVLYGRADSGIARLPRDCRVAVRAARLIYSDIGRSLRRNGFDSVNHRAYTTATRKLMLLTRAAGDAQLLRDRYDGPGLEVAEELVTATAT